MDGFQKSEENLVMWHQKRYKDFRSVTKVRTAQRFGMNVEGKGRNLPQPGPPRQ